LMRTVQIKMMLLTCLGTNRRWSKVWKRITMTTRRRTLMVWSTPSTTPSPSMTMRTDYNNLIKCSK
jgi:hypothetical protein